MGRQGDRQGDLMVMWSEMPRSPGHVFYDRLQEVLVGAGFDGFVEDACRAFYAKTMGAPSVPPGRYFRMHMVGYFEGIDSERGIAWRCSDSFSLREFLRLEATDRVPDHSWLSKTRGRLSQEVHETVFSWVLALIAERGLVRGERIGVDASTMEANAALRAIVRRDTGEGYREMLERMAQESGIETPTAEDLIRLDRHRTGKRLSNDEWVSATDPDARIARMKDGTTHLAYKPEHAVDLDTGAVLAAEVHAADQGDTTTITSTLDAARRNLTSVGAPPSPDDPAECVADKGYHARGLDGPGRRSVEDPDCRTAAQGHLALARRHGRAPGGLQQPRSAALRGRPAGDAPTSGTGRALVCSHPGPRWHAADVVAGPGERPQALSDPRRRAQSRAAHAPADRGRNPERGRRTGLVLFCPAPDHGWCHLRGHSRSFRRKQRRASSDRLHDGL